VRVDEPEVNLAFVPETGALETVVGFIDEGDPETRFGQRKCDGGALKPGTKDYGGTVRQRRPQYFIVPRSS